MCNVKIQQTYSHSALLFCELIPIQHSNLSILEEVFLFKFDIFTKFKSNLRTSLRAKRPDTVRRSAKLKNNSRLHSEHNCLKPQAMNITFLKRLSGSFFNHLISFQSRRHILVCILLTVTLFGRGEEKEFCTRVEILISISTQCTSVVKAMFLKRQQHHHHHRSSRGKTT